MYLKKVLKVTFAFILFFGIIASFSPIIAYIAFFLALLGFGIYAIHLDNCPRIMEDGKEYCSPIFTEETCKE